MNSGPAIANGTVYWGSSYRNFGLGVGNDACYALKHQRELDQPTTQPERTGPGCHPQAPPVTLDDRGVTAALSTSLAITGALQLCVCLPRAP